MEQLILKQTMSSCEIAELTGKSHDNVLKAIRGMELAWEKVTGVRFNASEYTDASGRKLPMYELTKLECLYIATKFNDEARAKLVLRWEKLEIEKITIANTKIEQAQKSAKRRNEISLRIRDIDISINNMMSERKSLIRERNIIDNQDYALLSFPMFPEYDYRISNYFPNKRIA